MSARPFLEMVQRMIAGEIPPPPIGRTLGMNVVEMGPDRAAFEMDAISSITRI
jgi:acyl-coenzyme A thioesterase PaaI-like protein